MDESGKGIGERKGRKKKALIIEVEIVLYVDDCLYFQRPYFMLYFIFSFILFCFMDLEFVYGCFVFMLIVCGTL